MQTGVDGLHVRVLQAECPRRGLLIVAEFGSEKANTSCCYSLKSCPFTMIFGHQQALPRVMAEFRYRPNSGQLM